MEWQFILLLFFGSLLVTMLSGMPVVFCFLVLNIVFIYFFAGGAAGLQHLVTSLFSSVSTFILLPIPLFILMGEVMFHSGVAPKMIDALDKWLGRLPGRLGLLAVGGGTLFAALTGTSLGSVAMLGSTLVPEMEKRGYKKSMSLGPILGSGGLAIMIPPSGMAVLVGAMGEISIGKILIGIIVPGLVMATLYAVYIVTRCRLQPSLAPAYSVEPPPLSEKFKATVQYVLPIGFIIFLVVGIIFIGVATPSEAAATGALGCFILAAFYKSLNRKMLKKSISSTVEITVMLMMLFAVSIVFSQTLSYTGASYHLAEFTLDLPLPPIAIIIAMQVVGLILGMFISPGPIAVIFLPLFMPVVRTLGFDGVWFGVIFLLNLEIASISPPFGLSLFVMKSVAPPDTTMEDCYRAVLPFVGGALVVMALLIAFPALVLWLPDLM